MPQRETKSKESAWSLCFDERARNRIAEEFTITEGLMSGLTNNGDKCNIPWKVMERMAVVAIR